MVIQVSHNDSKIDCQDQPLNRCHHQQPSVAWVPGKAVQRRGVRALARAGTRSAHRHRPGTESEPARCERSAILLRPLLLPRPTPATSLGYREAQAFSFTSLVFFNSKHAALTRFHSAKRNRSFCLYIHPTPLSYLNLHGH